jgi:hypothetical protein
MTGAVESQIRFELQVADSSEAREVEAALEQAGGQSIETTGEGRPGIAPLIIVVGAIAAVTAAADLFMRIRAKHMCQQIIDARNDKVKVTKNCDFRDGRIIVISSDDQKVEIHDVPDGLDVGKLMEAALKSGADAVKAVADAAGAKTDDPTPAGK